MQNLFNTSESNYTSLELHEEDSFTDLEFDVIWNNQGLEAKVKLPDFDIREVSLNPYSPPPLTFSKPEESFCGPNPTSA